MYSIKETQAKLTQLCRGEGQFVITNRGKPVFVALPIADYSALVETMDVLADPEAREAINRFQEGATTFSALDLEDEGFGL